MSQNQVTKQTILKATREKVWAAITDADRFGQWFGVALDGPFVAGEEAVGRLEPTTVDPEVARQQEPYRGQSWRVMVDRVEPMRLFSFRWHPYAVDPAHDYSAEPMTLVTFELADAEGGILLTVTESGFDLIPAARRAEAIKANAAGWEHQMVLIARYLDLGE